MFFRAALPRRERARPFSFGKHQQAPNPFFGFITAGALAQPTVQRGQLLRPFPQYLSDIDFGGYIGNSSYHSLQMKAEKRFSAGGTVLAAYTFSKLIGDTESTTSWIEGGTGSASVQDYSNLRAERAFEFRCETAPDTQLRSGSSAGQGA